MKVIRLKTLLSFTSIFVLFSGILNAQTFLSKQTSPNGNAYDIYYKKWILVGQVNAKGYTPTNSNTNILSYSWGNSIKVSDKSVKEEVLIFKLKNPGGTTWKTSGMTGVEFLINGDTLDAFRNLDGSFKYEEFVDETEYTYFIIYVTDVSLLSNIKRNGIQKVFFDLHPGNGKKIMYVIPKKIIYE